MSNPYFHFKQFTIHHDRCAMKVTTDACLFGAWCAASIKSEDLKNKILLDIGTGTGLLSLMIAQQATVVIEAIEIDDSAADQALENVMQSPFNSIHIINSDVVGFTPAKQYDIIVSNPPFYEAELESSNAQKNIAHHSSYLKLDELFKRISDLLRIDGTFYLLLPFKRKAAIEKGLQLHGLFVWEEVAVCQTENHPPFRWMIKGGNRYATKTIKEEIKVKEHGEYSKQFVDLLQPYYLYL